MTKGISVIGPRPIIYDELGEFGGDAALLCSAPGGISDLWQASKRNESTFESGERQRIELWEGLAFRVNIVARVVAINATVFSLCKRCGIAIVVEGPSSDRRRRVFVAFVNALCLIWRKSCFNWYCSHTQNGAQFC